MTNTCQKNKSTNKEKMMLLIARFSNPAKDLVAATLAWMCKEQDWKFDVYYVHGDEVSKQEKDEHIHKSDEGGLFSAHGSTLFGGRHYQAFNRVFAEFDVTVIMLDDLSLFKTLINSAANQIIVNKGILKLFKKCSDILGCSFPDKVVAVQASKLPHNFEYGITQYIYPEIVYTKAIGVTINQLNRGIDELHSIGVDKVCIYSFDKGIDTDRIEDMDQKNVINIDYDNYGDLTFSLADKWNEKVEGFDICEPVLASYWLPYSIQENRLQVCSERMDDAAKRLAPLVENKGEKVVYGRYAGGPICRANDDEDLFGLFKQNIAYEVVEPGRPVFRVFSQKEKRYPQPEKSYTDIEPTDDQLLNWAQKGKILTSLVFHSGELSHDDGIMNVMELSALTKVKVGIPVHFQRYTFDPDCIEPMLVPYEEGGVLGLCEPILHSGGFGIITEGLANPEKVAMMMEEARNSIIKIAGKKFAPRGVYCYLDTSPQNWNKKSEILWKEIGKMGFKYLLTSVQPGNSRILYQDNNITVLNLQSDIVYPYSPFVRVNSVPQMVEFERSISRTGKPGWLNAVIDTPVFASSSYLLKGKSRLVADKFELYREANLGSFFDYISKGGETNKIVSATPHTIYRYAKLLKGKGLYI